MGVEQAALGSAVVIAQLDHKFVLLSCEGNLLAMDQHAAHERIRLERLQAELHAVNTTKQPPAALTLRPVLCFEATREEFGVLKKATRLLQMWSVVLSPSESFSSNAAGSWSVAVSQIPVFMTSATPTALKEFALHIAEKHGRVNSSLPCVAHALATHACRGAIMFGDELSLQQCEELIGELRGCDFPFQCAHGRPSLVPLIDLNPTKRAECAVFQRERK